MVIDHVAAIESTHPGIDERCRQQDRAAERNEHGGELLRCGGLHRQQFAVMELVICQYLARLSLSYKYLAGEWSRAAQPQKPLTTETHNAGLHRTVSWPGRRATPRRQEV